MTTWSLNARKEDGNEACEGLQGCDDSKVVEFEELWRVSEGGKPDI